MDYFKICFPVKTKFEILLKYSCPWKEWKKWKYCLQKNPQKISLAKKSQSKLFRGFDPSSGVLFWGGMFCRLFFSFPRKRPSNIFNASGGGGWLCEGRFYRTFKILNSFSLRRFYIFLFEGVSTDFMGMFLLVEALWNFLEGKYEKEIRGKCILGAI